MIYFANWLACDCGCGQWYLADEQPVHDKLDYGIVLNSRLGKSFPAASLPSFEALKPAGRRADTSVVGDELDWLETLIDIADSGKNLVMYSGKC